jgi:hypothetical protein
VGRVKLDQIEDVRSGHDARGHEHHRRGDRLSSSRFETSEYGRTIPARTASPVMAPYWRAIATRNSSSELIT